VERNTEYNEYVENWQRKTESVAFTDAADSCSAILRLLRRKDFTVARQISLPPASLCWRSFNRMRFVISLEPLRNVMRSW